MTRRRPDAAPAEPRPPARSSFFVMAAINGVFALVLIGANVAMVWLIRTGWWASPLEILVGFVLIAAAVVALLFILDGIRRDAREVGFHPALEARNAWRRWRRRPGGRERFASQRHTSKKR